MVDAGCRLGYWPIFDVFCGLLMFFGFFGCFFLDFLGFLGFFDDFLLFF